MDLHEPPRFPELVREPIPDPVVGSLLHEVEQIVTRPQSGLGPRLLALQLQRAAIAGNGGGGGVRGGTKGAQAEQSPVRQQQSRVRCTVAHRQWERSHQCRRVKRDRSL